MKVRLHSKMCLIRYKTAPECLLSGPFQHSGADRNPGVAGSFRSYNPVFTCPCQGGCPGLPRTADPGATGAATAGAAVPSAAAAARTGLFLFKETAPLPHLRMVRRGMSLPPSAGSVFTTGPPQHRKREGVQGRLPGPERPAGPHLGEPPHSTASLNTFFTLRAHLEISW